MKILLFYYHYFFYSCKQWYESQGEKRLSGLYTVCLLSVMFSLNVFTIIVFTLSIFRLDGRVVNASWGVVIFLLFLALNSGYFYLRNGRQKALLLFNNVNSDERKSIKNKFIFYFIASITLIVLGLGIYIKQ